MAQHHDNKSKKQRPEPLEFRASDSDHQNTPSESLNNSSNLSPAERYIKEQAQKLSDQNSPQVRGFSVASSTSSIHHAENKNEWREKQVNSVYEQQPYRYKYGTPTTNFRRTSSSSGTNRTKKK